MGCQSLYAQYFFTGEVRDAHGDRLQNGSISVLSTGSSYRPGVHGEFEIISRKLTDSVILSFDGYEPYTASVSAMEFLQITLKSIPFPVAPKKRYLKSVFKDINSRGPFREDSHRTHSSLVENPFVAQSATVSFPANIDRSSYNIVRKFLDMGSRAPRDAVRIEELLNYFNSYYECPDTGEIFHCSSDLMSCPWNENHKLLSLNICAGKTDLQKAPPANLVFLIDASGSMDLPDKLPMIKSSIRLLINNLRDIDTVSVIEFGGRLRVLLHDMSGSEKNRIIGAIEGMTPDGPTPGEEAIKLAYEVAHSQFIKEGNNKIILITDGDISEGPSGKRNLEDFIGEQSREGISFNCIGVGMDDYKNSELPELAEKGNGTFAVAADEETAEGLLVSQLAPAFFCMADSALITTSFNSGLVKEYRLIGFDNRRDALKDSTLSAGLEGRKIGSGHSLLALFELVPAEVSVNTDTVAEVKISYCLPGQSGQTGQHVAKMISYSCPNKQIPFERAENKLKKTGCIALLGMKLQGSGYVSQISWTDIEKMAKKAFSGNNCVDKEYLELVAKAKKVYK
jgi:Ca-activated chloride channel family protein